MRAIQVLDYGEAETLTTTEIPRPVPGDGEAQVQVAYAGVNFIDVYMRRGMYANNRAYATSLPLTLGMEGAGIVTATGPGVNDIATGDRVAYCLNPGSYAEFAVVPTWKLVKLPRDVSLAIGAAIMLQGCTAHYLSHTLFPLASGHTCLVHAGAGGVGQLLIQLAKMRGARVLTTVGNDEKADIARRRGADEVILYRDTDFRQAVMAVTGGEGVDVVYESVGRETFDDSILSLKHRGTCVLFGDGAGAAVLRAVDGAGANTDRGILSTHIYTDGSRYDQLYVDGGPATNGSSGHVRMQGQEVFRFAVNSMASSVRTGLEANGLTLKDINWLIPHQANSRIIAKVGETLDVPDDKVIVTVQNHANTSAATIPLAMTHGFERQLFKPGDLLALTAMGGGFSWGSAILRW